LANVYCFIARNDGVASLIYPLAALTMLAPLAATLSACGPSYSPDTYSTNAAQQANKVESGVIAGVRPVQISAQGTVGGVAGAAAGGIAGSQVGTGPTSAFTAIGGSLVGGIAGVATEHIIGDTNGFEYIVRKANGDMVSVAQKDAKPLRIGQNVLVIAGPQARIVADYTTPSDTPPKAATQSGSASQPGGSEASPSHPSPADAHPPAAQAVPSSLPVTTVPPQLPAAFAAPSATPPAIITPRDGSSAQAPSASSAPAGDAPKP
jgi:outer membrane lipoprotein SlyB